MDKSECKRIIEENIGLYMQQFGIPHWNVTIFVEPNQCDAGGKYVAGECVRRIDYNQAVITFNPEAFAPGDAEHVLDVLRHELYHIVISPFDLYACAVEEIIGEDHPARNALDRVWRHVMEKTVINLGRAYVGLTDGRRGPVDIEGPDEGLPEPKGKRQMAKAGMPPKKLAAKKKASPPPAPKKAAAAAPKGKAMMKGKGMMKGGC